MEKSAGEIRVVIGLGNPGRKYHFHRHSVGFRVVDLLAEQYGAQWQEKGDALYAQVLIGDRNITLIKPQTFMNESGRVIPALLKSGIAAENILVVHDEMERPFGSLHARVGGSHRGHNGLRSIIAACGPDFMRVRVGIDRPEHKHLVSDYVLSNFSEPSDQVEQLIEDAACMVEESVRAFVTE